MSVVSYAHSQVQTLQEEIKGHLETNILFKLTINLDKKNRVLNSLPTIVIVIHLMFHY